MRKIGNAENISLWESRGLSNEIIKRPSTPNNLVITPKLSYLGTRVRVKFDGSCLERDKITYPHGTIVNICIVYKFSPNFGDTEPALENCLFDAVKLKMLILISTNIQDMVMDLIQEEFFYILMVEKLKM